MWHTLYINVFFFLKYNHAVDEVDIDEGCHQKYVDESKFYQNSDIIEVETGLESETIIDHRPK
jgi:hypothetical protein